MITDRNITAIVCPEEIAQIHPTIAAVPKGILTNLIFPCPLFIPNHLFFENENENINLLAGETW